MPTPRSRIFPSKIPLGITASIAVFAEHGFVTLSKGEMAIVMRYAAEWKNSLISISGIMKALNEPIARAANIEDNCTGKFFDSFSLLDNCSCVILPTGFLP